MKPINFLSFVFMILALSGASAEVKLPAIFSDHMVLQRGTAVPIWGWASPNEAVSVAVGLTRANALADDKGNWAVTVKDLAISDKPVEIDVAGQNNQVAIHDVLVGDVWLCAGESHMAVPLSQSNTAKDELPKADHPQLRFFVPKFHTALTPQSDVEGTWQICTPDTAKSFSEVGYYFAKEISERENAPVGVIGLYGRDTSAQAWIDLDSVAAASELKTGYVLNFIQDSNPLDLTALGRTHDQWMASVGNAYETAKKKWNADNALAQKNKQPSPPKPSPPATPEPMRPDDARLPAILNNALVAPLAPYALKGVIWYQGESNLGQQTYLSLLSTLIESWRKQWHRDDLPFLFVQAPPHPAKPPLPGENSTLAWLREVQVLTLKKVPNTGMAATIDLPYDKTIRSVNNATVAQRLVSLARNLAYKEDIASACPIFDSFRIDGNKIYVTFKNIGHGLMVNPPSVGDATQSPADASEIKDFAIAGSDHKFVWAKATLEGPDIVSVTADEVPDPVFVQYGWHDSPEINLYNDAHLPVCSFRSDQPTIPPPDASLAAQTDDFFSVEKIRYFDKSTTSDLPFFKVTPVKNDDGSTGTTTVFTPYLEADVKVKDSTRPSALIARAYFYDKDKKLIASVQQPGAKSTGGVRRQYLPIWPAILPKDSPSPVFFVVPDAVLQVNNWSAVVVFGDAKGVAAQLHSEGDDFARLDDFAYPGKEPPLKQADNAVQVAEDRQTAVDPIVTHVEPTGNPQQPQITLFMRPPLGVTRLSDAKGVLCLSLLANTLESVKRQLQGFEPNQDLSGTLKFAEDHQLIIICWGSRRLWNPRMNWDDLSPDSVWDSDQAFDQVADAWDHGVQYFIKEYKIPQNGYLLWGMCGSAQYACRLALRKPQYFLAIHAHMPGSFDKPTPEARKILWCLTTGELESGHANSLRFYKQCKALGYPMIYKAVIGLGHSSSPIEENLGEKFFEYALSVRDQRLKYDAASNDPLAQFQASQTSPTESQPWIESFAKPAYVGDVVNQEMFSADDTDMIPASFRTPLPTKDIADAWNK